MLRQFNACCRIKAQELNELLLAWRDAHVILTWTISEDLLEKTLMEKHLVFIN
jgi:hypothetical protein